MLAAGQLTFGFMRSSLALSFLAPQDGNRFRGATISFSIPQPRSRMGNTMRRARQIEQPLRPNLL